MRAIAIPDFSQSTVDHSWSGLTNRDASKNSPAAIMKYACHFVADGSLGSGVITYWNERVRVGSSCLCGNLRKPWSHPRC